MSFQGKQLSEKTLHMDKQAVARLLNGLFYILGLIFTGYLLLCTFSIFEQATEHYTSFTLFVFVLVSLMTIRQILQEGSTGVKFGFRIIFFGIVCIAAVATAIFMRQHSIRLNMIQPFFTPIDMVVGYVMVISLLILTWFHWGSILTAIVTLSILYLFEGHLLPWDTLQHPMLNKSFCMSFMGLNSTAGIFWFVPLAADKLFFLVLYAALLLGIGMLPLMLEIGKAVGRHVRGGSAFPALVGSAMTGMVMGQAVSNTMLTGQLTIPMMKKHGWTPEQAGAIESVASSSGQLLPPILGLAAFMIAATLNIPYIDVAMAATLPALLFVLTVTICVLLAARIHNIGYLMEQIDRTLIIRLFPSFFLSFVVVLVLLFMYYSPNLAAVAGMGIMFAAALFQGKGYRPTFKRVKESYYNGLGVCTSLCLLLVAIGPLAQVSTTTDIASKLGVLLANVVPHHNLLLILVGAMIVSLLLGMGLPTPVAYLLVAVSVAPFLQELGVPAFSAHMFVFYFAVFSTISPPVAISCLAAAKISGGTFMGTTKESLKIAFPSFCVPFAFVFNPEILAFPHVTMKGFIAFMLTLLCQFFVAVAIYGCLLDRLKTVHQILFAVSAACGFLYLISGWGIYLPVFLGLGPLLVLWILVVKKTGLGVGSTN